MANLFQPSLAPALDSDGDPISGAKLWFYLPGTTTPTAVYTSFAGTTEHSNPVVADSAGRFDPVYLEADTNYRIRLTDAAGGNIIWDIDPVNGSDAQMVATAAAAAVAAAAAAAASAAAASASAALALSIGSYMEPYLVLSDDNTTADDTTWQTMDLSARIPKGSVAVYMQFAVRMETVNVNTHWRFRAVGDFLDGINGDGSRRFTPPQTASIYFETERWVRVSSDGKFEYKRSNSGGVFNYWKAVLLGYQ